MTEDYDDLGFHGDMYVGSNPTVKSEHNCNNLYETLRA